MPDLKLNHRAIVIKTSWYWNSNRQVDQWDRIEDPEIKPHSYCHLKFDKGTKKYTMERKASSINGAGLTGCLYVEE